MTGYTKLFQDIVTSTIWGEDDKTRIVWITMLALKDSKHFVSASVPGLARQANVTLEDCEKAIGKLESPDIHSRSQEYEGRRVKRVAGGWLILNGEKYRNRMNADERREYNRQKQADYRAKKKLVKPLKGEPEYMDALRNDATREQLDKIVSQSLPKYEGET